jgi:hypothetical protein
MPTDLLGVAGLTILIMITPGADLALVTRNTVMGGKSAGEWTSARMLTGNLVHLTYCLLGVVQHSQPIGHQWRASADTLTIDIAGLAYPFASRIEPAARILRRGKACNVVTAPERAGPRGKAQLVAMN